MRERHLPDADNASWMTHGKIPANIREIPNKPPKELLSQFSPEEWRPGLGVVYVLAGSAGLVKIGKSKTPRSRILDLCRDYRPVETGEVSYDAFYLTQWHTDFAKTEKALHQRLDDRRSRLELFRVTPEEVLAELQALPLKRIVRWLTSADCEALMFGMFGQAAAMLPSSKPQQ